MIDTVIHGDALAVLKTLPDNSVDAIVTDPPAGISFMGKDWDNFNSGDISQKQSPSMQREQELRDQGVHHIGFFVGRGQTIKESTKARQAFIAFLREVMTEALRVLKPGGHALVWALPRTSHWTATALEDAGFEVRDAIFHHFGSGFPKSTAIDKQIDKMLGKEREVIGEKSYAYPDSDRPSKQSPHNGITGGPFESSFQGSTHPITKPATPESAQWAGYGTSLKPACEIWHHVQKPFTALGYCAIINQQIKQLEADLCSLTVKHAEKNLRHTQVKSNGAKAVSVQESALIPQEESQEQVTATGKAVASLPMMDISGLESIMTMCLNIVTSWSNTWADLFSQMSKSTIEITTDLTTDLRTLNSCLLTITPEYMLDLVTRQPGSQSLVLTVESLLSVVLIKWNILTHSALSSASEQVPTLQSTENVSQKTDLATQKATSSKPSTEIWWLVRKPLAESSIAANVLAWGTGGLNIDATRIEGASWHRPTMQNMRGGNYNNPDAEHLPIPKDSHPQGRWPSHLLLSHSLWCQPLGVKRVRVNDREHDRHNGAKVDRAIYGDYNANVTTGHADTDGMELVEAYQCHESCPIAELDRQSGVRKSGGRHVNEGYQQPGMRGNTYSRGEYDRQPDEGKASRYFTNFPPADYIPFGYFSKASRAERNAGCEGLPSKFTATMNDGIGKREHNENEPNAWNGNHHPTVKSLALMRWLIRLITPPDGIVLDMFGGSGSTACAAIQENCHFILVEQDASYVQICEARIAHAMTHEPQTVQVATKKVPIGGGRPIEGNPRKGGTVYNGLVKTNSSTYHGDQDGMEEVEDWDCSPDCPIRIIGEQSGERKVGGVTQKHKAGTGIVYGGRKKAEIDYGYGDTGTAARYFQQFPPDSLFAECDVEVSA